MKKILGVIIGGLLLCSVLAFTPAGESSSKKNEIAEMSQQIQDLKVQVADLNLRVTKLENANDAAKLKKEEKKQGGFHAN